MMQSTVWLSHLAEFNYLNILLYLKAIVINNYNIYSN